jgi:hypothetical protein
MAFRAIGGIRPDCTAPFFRKPGTVHTGPAPVDLVGRTEAVEEFVVEPLPAPPLASPASGTSRPCRSHVPSPGVNLPGRCRS